MPNDYDPNRTYSMAPQTAFGWYNISIEAYFRLRKAGFLRENVDGNAVAKLIHDCYVEFSDEGKAKDQKDAK